MKNQLTKLVFATFVAVMMSAMVTKIEEDVATKKVVIGHNSDYIYIHTPGALSIDPPYPTPPWPPDVQ